MNVKQRPAHCKQPKPGYFRQYRNPGKGASCKNGPYGHRSHKGKMAKKNILRKRNHGSKSVHQLYPSKSFITKAFEAASFEHFGLKWPFYMAAMMVLTLKCPSWVDLFCFGTDSPNSLIKRVTCRHLLASQSNMQKELLKKKLDEYEQHINKFIKLFYLLITNNRKSTKIYNLDARRRLFSFSICKDNWNCSWNYKNSQSISLPWVAMLCLSGG